MSSLRTRICCSIICRSARRSRPRCSWRSRSGRGDARGGCSTAMRCAGADGRTCNCGVRERQLRAARPGRRGGRCDPRRSRSTRSRVSRSMIVAVLLGLTRLYSALYPNDRHQARRADRLSRACAGPRRAARVYGEQRRGHPAHRTRALRARRRAGMRGSSARAASGAGRVARAGSAGARGRSRSRSIDRRSGPWWCADVTATCRWRRSSSRCSMSPRRAVPWWCRNAKNVRGGCGERRAAALSANARG